MQIGVLDIVNGELRARSDNDRVMVAEIAKVRAIADQGLNFHGEGSPLHRPENFTQVTV